MSLQTTTHLIRTPPISNGRPLTPRNVNTPYARPPVRSTPNPPSHATTAGRQNTDSDSFQQLLDEIRKNREEQRGLRQDVHRMTTNISRLEANYRLLADQIKEQEESSFSIESSPYKDDLLAEVSILYIRSLVRQPKQQDIGEIIMKVLRQEGKKKAKFSKAKTFICNKLTDHRCEERRRLFGHKPCELFSSLTTAEFAERFMGTLKAPSEYRLTYMRHLAILRKFARECPLSKNDTFKRFRKWLDDCFTNEIPSEEEWTKIMDEDEGYNYSVPQQIVQDNPYSGYMLDDHHTQDNEHSNSGMLCNSHDYENGLFDHSNGHMLHNSHTQENGSYEGI